MHNENIENLVVVKRSGQRVEFNPSKVALAIKKAFDSVGDSNETKSFKTFEKVLKYINANYKDRKTINVEDIQDIIEDTLYNQKHLEVYNEFREYRNKRALSRKVFSEKQQHKFLKAIAKIEKDEFNDIENTNPRELIYKFGNIIYNEYTKVYVLDTKFTRAVEEGNIYIHNLNYFALGILSNTHLKLINTSLDNIINDLINAEKDINGEISLNDLDEILISILLKEYKKKFKFNLKRMLELFGFYEFINFKKIEEIIDKEKDINFNINKFDAFNFNNSIKNIFLTSYNFTKEDINKLLTKYIYRIYTNLENNCEPENAYTISFGSNKTTLGNLINNEILDLLSKNEFNNINNIIKIINSEITSNKLLEAIKKNKKIYLQLIKNDTKVEYFANGGKILNNINGENISNGRMIVSNTSINLARLGLKYRNKPLEEFYKELDSLCELTKNELCLSFETIGNKTKTNYKVLFNGNILDDEKLEPGQKIRKVIKNGTLVIGVIGLKECVQLLSNSKKEELKLINEILDYLNKKCEQFMTNTKLNFGIYETTNKQARCSLLKIDKAIYGNIENITDKKAYELIDNNYIEDYKTLANLTQKFTLGKLITFKIPANSSSKKITDIINVLAKNNIEFAKVVVGKDEY